MIYFFIDIDVSHNALLWQGKLYKYITSFSQLTESSIKLPMRRVAIKVYLCLCLITESNKSCARAPEPHIESLNQSLDGFDRFVVRPST